MFRIAHTRIFFVFANRLIRRILQFFARRIRRRIRAAAIHRPRGRFTNTTITDITSRLFGRQSWHIATFRQRTFYTERFYTRMAFGAFDNNRFTWRTFFLFTVRDHTAELSALLSPTFFFNTNGIRVLNAGQTTMNLLRNFRRLTRFRNFFTTNG